jgi:hypothetical protein
MNRASCSADRQTAGLPGYLLVQTMPQSRVKVEVTESVSKYFKEESKFDPSETRCCFLTFNYEDPRFPKVVDN